MRPESPYTVRYEAVNAMLLNEFLKVHRELEEQKRDHCAPSGDNGRVGGIAPEGNRQLGSITIGSSRGPESNRQLI
jgi:hypothetical protein